VVMRPSNDRTPEASGLATLLIILLLALVMLGLLQAARELRSELVYASAVAVPGVRERGSYQPDEVTILSTGRRLVEFFEARSWHSDYLLAPGAGPGRPASALATLSGREQRPVCPQQANTATGPAPEPPASAS
jgi:hypothetical protein